MIDLYLIRHAHAVDGDGMRDDDRPLSAEGRKQALDVGAALAKERVLFARVVTSPLVRAVETAEILAVMLGFAGGLSVSDALVPEARWKDLSRHVLEVDGEGSLALVGHEPSMGHFLGKLLGQKSVSLHKGAVVRLAFRSVDEPARLVWTLSPKHLSPRASL